ncbi:MAG: hypothetical protein R8N23_06620 [Reichenbachiella sp.]|uniref:hypothetical protein n=1 Tax=Reichenbachiella sp. TaxID=2184521 RepID=UPI002967499F|nr:hypothetical protein [Reichenbachiella sp.]MDW3209518.1 hypothetical protein [Reichenbachiella sp.]
MKFKLKHLKNIYRAVIILGLPTMITYMIMMYNLHSTIKNSTIENLNSQIELLEETQGKNTLAKIQAIKKQYEEDIDGLQDSILAVNSLADSLAIKLEFFNPDDSNTVNVSIQQIRRATILMLKGERDSIIVQIQNQRIEILNDIIHRSKEIEELQQSIINNQQILLTKANL